MIQTNPYITHCTPSFRAMSKQHGRIVCLAMLWRNYKWMEHTEDTDQLRSTVSRFSHRRAFRSFYELLKLLSSLPVGSISKGTFSVEYSFTFSCTVISISDLWTHYILYFALLSTICPPMLSSSIVHPCSSVTWPYPEACNTYINSNNGLLIIMNQLVLR